ncbi:MAG TPA: IPT/TIG domain-containing protein [Solirubrobacteraceae bacterium]|nr:IPT/TIG domain-containing protein [Solirubrobacteraceae bacterium]
MELRARTPLLRRAAMTAALAALAAPATAGAAPTAHASAKQRDRSPVVTSVSPRSVAIGEVLTLRGRNFRAGVKKSTVVFKADGQRAVFAKADRSTSKLLWITVPTAVKDVMRAGAGEPLSTRFRLRVLGATLGARYTTLKASPTIAPCEDGDLLGHDLEAAIGTDPCVADTDGDAIPDGYEYQSAKDLNDDEDQDPNGYLPYPGKRPYPNPLDEGDADKDFDGDSLTLREEHALWRHTWETLKSDPYTLTPLSYSDGEQYSRSRRIDAGDHAGRRRPTLRAGERDGQPTFAEWAQVAGYRTVMLAHRDMWGYKWPYWDHESVRVRFGIFDVNRDGTESPRELGAGLLGFLPDDMRDADADGLNNYEETHGFMVPEHWASCYPDEKPFGIGYGRTAENADRDGDGVRDAVLDPDTDGDGVRDGADDDDHDDIPNVMELSRIAASGLDDTDGRDCAPRKEPALPTDPGRANVFGRVHPFNPCLPDVASRTCPRYYSETTGAPFDDSPNWFAFN